MPDLATLLFLGGFAQLCILIASAMVPFQLDWKQAFQPLPPLLRQMYWVYGGYVVLSILALGLLSVFNATELATGSRLARSVCLYNAVFWGLRLPLQIVFDTKQYLTTWWLKLGYHTLTVLFLSFTLLYGWAALHPTG